MMTIKETFISVFSTTVNRVENNNKYFWRYQRYILIQEYFEKPVLGASPIILVSYVGLIVRHILYRLRRGFDRQRETSIGKYGLSGNFKMIPTDSWFTERCTAFEHAATYDYARFVVEHKKVKMIGVSPI
ncbi:unnamed protein product [Rotaria sp. Silwood1]|nr:unnamed protein product [Rotaria sp. Silwood1]